MTEDLDSNITVEMVIERVKEEQRSKERDLLIREFPLTVFLNEQECTTLFCSPQKFDYLAVGFLYLAGLLSGKEDLQEIKVDKGKGFVFVRTKTPTDEAEKFFAQDIHAYGAEKETSYTRVLDPRQEQGRQVEFPPQESALQVRAEDLFQLMSALLNASLLFKTTGGVHSAALAQPDKILFFSEDVGRHNAVDKIAGECILKNIVFHDKILLSSGRVSAEIVVKAAKLGLPLIVSHSAPTSLSVDLAEKMGITLVGFVRGRRLNIYTHATKITL